MLTARLENVCFTYRRATSIAYWLTISLDIAREPWVLRLRKRLPSTITDTSLCLGRGVLLCKLFNARSLRNKTILSSFDIIFVTES